MTRLNALLAALALLFWSLPLAAQAPEERPNFARDRIVVETSEGERYGFLVELAVTQRQQAYGLMHRRALRPDEGMLFIKDPVQRASFWMKNTLIPLDMIFIDEEGVISEIAERVPPRSLDSVLSAEPVRAVLEINGGLSEQLGIAPGATVHHETFGNALPE